ncbi:transcription initiation factor TFIID subunit 12 isoform X3 [Nematostella vectensis]|uniref:transcription initiation factor TFIID subunit 12 isoform X3 n=1 Tax=Nematostella vectensis TaxID=45351 RepID=UPI002076E93D|nr:transcription initiation factor TFIID subunit 12 isoform X3 [Nematostella vectensis]
MRPRQQLSGLAPASNMASQQPNVTVVSGAGMAQRKTVEMIQEVQKRIQSIGPGPYHSPEQTQELETLKLIYARLTGQQDVSMQALQLWPNQIRQVISHQPNPTTSQVHITMATPVSQMVAGATSQGVITQQTIAPMQRIAPASTTTGTGQKMTVIPATTTVTLLPQGAAVPGSVGGAGTTSQQIQHMQIQAQPAGSAVTAQTVSAQPTMVTVASMASQPIVPSAVTAQSLIHAQRTLAGSPSTTAQLVTTGGQSIAGIKLTQGALPPGIKLTTQTPTLVQSLPIQQRQLAPSKPIAAAPSGSGSIPNIAPAPSVSSIPKSLVTHGGRLQTRVDTSSPQPTQVLTKRRIQELLHEIDPREQMDDEVEDLLLQVADDFIENVVNSSAQIAKHRKSNTLEVKDVQLHLERCWNMWIPGFGADELRPYKKAASTEAHKQRLALIRKSLKK